MSSSPQLPERLDMRRFAQEAAHLAGTLLLLKMDRLCEEISREDASFASKSAAQSASKLDTESLHWQLKGELVQRAGAAPQLWLHLQLQGHVPLQCQRCLGPVRVPLDVQRSFRFVRSEEEAAAQDDEAEEDLLVLAKQFNALELIEDEALMALPMVPMHDTCPQPVKLASSDDDFQAELAAKPKAFAALGALKKRAG
jgi:uncharacterized protein